MQQPLRPYAIAGVALVGASLITVPPVAPPPRNVQVRAIQLVDTADSPLGDGTALVFGGSGLPIPPPQYVDAADTLYLQPLGFTGTAQSSFEPNGSYALTVSKASGSARRWVRTSRSWSPISKAK